MVFVGKTKIDGTRRISFIKELADLLELEAGDELQYHVENGKIVVYKDTKIYYGGFEFESKEIEQRLKQYENERIDDFVDEATMDHDELERRAYEQYLKDKESKKKY